METKLAEALDSASKHEDELKNLASQVDAARSNSVLKDQERDEMAQTIDALETETKGLKSELHAMIEKSKSLEEKCAAANSALDSFRSEKEMASEELSELGDLRAQIDDLNQRVERGEAALEKEREKVKKTVERYKALQKKSKDEEKTHKAEIGSLETKLAEALDSASTHKEQLGAISEDMSEQFNMNALAQQDTIERLCAELEASKESASSLRKEVASLQNSHEEVDGIKNALKLANEEKEKAKERHNNTKKKLETVVARFKLLQTQNTEILAELKTAKTNATKNAQETKTFAALQNEISVLQATCEQLTEEVFQKDAQLESTKSSLRDLEQTSQAGDESLQATIERLTDELFQKDSLNASLTAHMEAQAVKLENSESAIEDLQKQLESKKKKFQEKLEKGNDRFKAAQKKHKEHATEIESELSVLRTKHAEVLSCLSATKVELDAMKVAEKDASSSLEAERLLHTEQLQAQKDEVRNYEEKIKTLEGEYNNCHDELERVSLNNSALLDNEAKLSAQVQALANEKEELSKEMNTHIASANERITLFEDTALVKFEDSKSKLSSSRKKSKQETQEAFFAMQNCLQEQLSSLSGMLEEPSMQFFDDAKTNESNSSEIVIRFKKTLGVLDRHLSAPMGMEKQNEFLAELSRAYLRLREEILTTAKKLDVDASIILPEESLVRKESVATINALERRVRDLQDDLRRADAHEVLVLKESALAQAHMRNEYEAEIARLHQSADEALATSSDWIRMNDSSTGKQYYVNRKTGISQWNVPAELLVNVDKGEKEILKKENIDLSAKLSALEKDLENGKSENYKLLTVEEEARLKARRAEVLDGEIQMLQSKLRGTEEELRGAVGRAHEAEKSGAAADTKIIGLETKNRELDVKILDLEKKNRELNADLEKLEMRNANAVKNAAMEARNIALAEMQNGSEASTTLTEELKKLEIECERLSAEKLKAVAELEAKQNIILDQLAEEKVKALADLETEHNNAIDQLRTSHVLALQDAQAEANVEKEEALRALRKNLEKDTVFETPLRLVEKVQTASVEPSFGNRLDISTSGSHLKTTLGSTARSITSQRSSRSSLMTPQIARQRAQLMAQRLFGGSTNRDKTQQRI